MAWGYWSATSVSDRGRSPRREKDKQHQSLYHQPSQQQMHQAELSAQSTYATVQELGVTVPGMGIATEEPPCMIQGGSFYSYSAATAAAAAAAVNRRISNIVDGSGGGPSSLTSIGIQVLPRERHVRPGTSTHPPSPGSDSAEYEQPLVGHLRSADISPPSCLGSPPHHHHYHHHHHHDDIFAQPGTSSRVTKLLQCPPDAMEDELSEAELEEVAANAELIYGPTATCRVHGPCSQQPLPPLPPESSLSMTSLFDVEPAGPSQFQFNEITWGRCSRKRMR